MTNRIIGIATVGIPVADQERALDFYVGRLGLEKSRDLPFGPGLRWVEVGPAPDGPTIALTPPGGVAPGVDTGIRLVTEAVDELHAHLSEQGTDVDPVLRFGEGVPPMFSFRDPDGNTLYVVEQTRSS